MMRVEVLEFLDDPVSRRLAAAWPVAASRWPARNDPTQDDGLVSEWSAVSGIPESLVEQFGLRLVLMEICDRESGMLDPLARAHLSRLAAARAGLVPPRRQAEGPRREPGASE